MIFFKAIKFKNFLSTGNYFTEINLCNSTNTLVVGTNGAGKSTLLQEELIKSLSIISVSDTQHR